jgi:hypothetical protein
MALNEEQVGKIRQMLASSAWNDVVKPVLAQRGNQALRALTLFPSERTGDLQGLTDDQLRVQVKEVEWMLSCWSNEIAVFEHNRRIEELDAETNGANLRT